MAERGSLSRTVARAVEADDEERQFKEENAKWGYPSDVVFSMLASIIPSKHNWHIWFCVLLGLWFFFFCNTLAIEFCKAFCKRLLGMGATAASKKDTTDAIAQLTEQLRRAQDQVARTEAAKSHEQPSLWAAPEGSLRYELLEAYMAYEQRNNARRYRGVPSRSLASASSAPLCLPTGGAGAGPSTSPPAPTASMHASDLRDFRAELERDRHEPAPALTNAPPTLGAMLDEGLITYFDD